MPKSPGRGLLYSSPPVLLPPNQIPPLSQALPSPYCLVLRCSEGKHRPWTHISKSAWVYRRLGATATIPEKTRTEDPYNRLCSSSPEWLACSAQALQQQGKHTAQQGCLYLRDPVPNAPWATQMPGSPQHFMDPRDTSHPCLMLDREQSGGCFRHQMWRDCIVDLQGGPESQVDRRTSLLCVTAALPELISFSS